MSAIAEAQLRPVPVKRLLLVGESDEIVAKLRSKLPAGTWVVERAADNASVLPLVRTRTFDVILTGEHTSGGEDIELLRKIRKVHPHTRLIIIADEGTPSDVITAMREHAFSYFSKPYSLDTLVMMVQRAIAQPAWDDGIDVISATPEWIRIRARCDLPTADRVLHFFDEIADLPEPEKSAVGIAMREMLLNAIEHGGNLDPNEYVEIAYVRARHMVTCRITDPGEGFALHDVPHAAIGNPADDPMQHVKVREAQGLRPGGFGVLLTRHMVDELIYGEDGNDVLLVKYLQTEQQAS